MTSTATGPNQIVVGGVNMTPDVQFQADINFYTFFPANYGASPSATATVNYTAIQAALSAANAAGGGKVEITTPGLYSINRTLVICSNTYFEIAPGVTIQMAAGVNNNMIVNAAYGVATTALGYGANLPGNRVVSMTSVLNTATVTTATAHGLAIGDYIAVTWAAPDYYAGVHCVLSVPSTTTLTCSLAGTPQQATAYLNPEGALGYAFGGYTGFGNGNICWRKADINITIINNGTFDHNGANQSSSGGSLLGNALHFNGVYNAKVTGRWINSRLRGLDIECATTCKFFDLDGHGQNSAGNLYNRSLIQGCGPLTDIVVDRAAGNTTDNLIAFGATDYINSRTTEGTICGLSIRNIYVDNCQNTPLQVFGHVYDVSLSGGGTNSIDQVFSTEALIEGVYGSSQAGTSTLKLSESISNITLKNFYVSSPGDVITASGLVSEIVYLENIQSTSPNAGSLLSINAQGVNSNIRKLTMNSCVYGQLASVTPTAGSVSGTNPNFTVTFTLPVTQNNNGIFYPGQQIVVKGSTPSSYDGLQTISAVTSNTGNNAAQQLTISYLPTNQTNNGAVTVQPIIVAAIYGPSTFLGSMLYMAANQTVSHLVMNGCAMEAISSSNGQPNLVNQLGIVTNLTMRDCRWWNACNNFFSYMVNGGGGSIGTITFDNVQCLGNSGSGNQLFAINAGTVGTANILDTVFDGTSLFSISRILNSNIATSINVNVNNCVMACDTTTPYRVVGGAGMVIRSTNSSYGSTLAAIASGGASNACTVFGWDVPIDPLAANIVTTTDGQYCFSTRATSAATKGPTKYSAGTAAWVALGTGAAGVNTVLT